MKRKISMLLFSIIFAFSFFACTGGGTPSQNNGGDPDLVLTSLAVHGQEALDLKRPSFTFTKSKTSVTQDDVTAKFKYGKETDKEIKVIVEGGGTLKEGSNTLTLKVDAVPGQHKKWVLPIVIKIQETPTLTLTSLAIFSIPAKDIDTAPKISLSKDKTTIIAENVDALFSYGRITNKKLPVTVTGAENLKKGANTIKLSVAAKDNEYKAWGPQDVIVTILENDIATLTLKSLKIHGVDVDNLNNPSVMVKDDVTTIEPINVTAKFDYGTQHDVEIPVEIEHGEDIEAGENIITLKVQESAGEYLAWKKDVVVTKKGTPQNLTLSSLSVHKVACTNIPDAPVCEVPQDKTSVTPADVLAQFNYGDKLNKALEVEVLNGATLNPGENIINLRVPAKQYRYNEWTGSVKVIRKDTAVDLTLDSLFIHDQEVMNNKVSFKHKHKTVTTSDVKATFILKTGVKKIIPVEVKDCPATLEAGKATNIKLFVPASKDEYREKEIIVEVTREALPPKEPSSITRFALEGVETKIDKITADTVLSSGALKPVVTLETDRMFEKIESTEFEKAQYENNYKRTATLTLKDNLPTSGEKTVTIKVTTRTPDEEQENLEKVLTFKIKLVQGTLTVNRVEIEGNSAATQNQLIKVRKNRTHVYVYVTNNNVNLPTATLEEGGSTTKYQGEWKTTYFVFKNVVFAEEEKTFTVQMKGANATQSSFVFKAKYEVPVTGNVEIKKVVLNRGNGDEIITNNAQLEVSKPNGITVEVHLQEEYEEMKVKIGGVEASQPYAPGNLKIFSITINGLQKNVAKEIEIVATAKGKAEAKFKFTLTFKRPADARIVAIVEAKGSDDARFWPCNFSGSTFGPVQITGDQLEGIKVIIEDLDGKDASKLKIEVDGKGGKQEGSFSQDGSNWVSTITYSDGPVISTNGTNFALKLIENNQVIENYTLIIKTE